MATTYDIQKLMYPKISNDPLRKFGYGIAAPKKFNFSSPVHVVIALHGAGETEEKRSLEGLMNWAGWYVNNMDPSFFGACCRWPVAFLLVQTTDKSKFSEGEIDFALSRAYAMFNVINEPIVTGLSLGGFGLINWGDPLTNGVERLQKFAKAIFVMPGGGDGIGRSFAVNAVKAGLKCLFIHAADDKIAPPALSIRLNKEIKDLGGDSELVMYESGGHNIANRPFNAFYPWPMTNATNMKVVKDSYVPVESIYSWAVAGPVVQDVLLLTSQVWQRADGSCYTKDL